MIYWFRYYNNNRKLYNVNMIVFPPGSLYNCINISPLFHCILWQILYFRFGERKNKLEAMLLHTSWKWNILISSFRKTFCSWNKVGKLILIKVRIKDFLRRQPCRTHRHIYLCQSRRNSYWKQSWPYNL